MSFKFKNIGNNNISKEISSLYDDENEKYNDEEQINEINQNDLNSKIGSQFKPNMVNGDKDEANKLNFDSLTKKENLSNIDKANMIIENCYNKDNINIINNYDSNIEEEFKEEEIYKESYVTDGNETQFYELNTNKLVDIIKNDYNDIYTKQNEDISKFVDKLAKENSSLKKKIKILNLEILKLKTQNEFYLKSLIKNNESELINKNNNTSKKGLIYLNLEIHEKEKENIKNEYELILVNNPSSLILKNIKSLYEKLIKCKDDLYNTQKINILLQEENDKVKEKNEFIKSYLSEEKNKIIEKIIEIQDKMNSQIELNKNMLFNNTDNSINKYNFFLQNNNDNDNISEENNDENLYSSKNNPHLFYIEKIKNLIYEKNKLLSCNYDFFVKINDLSQTIEEKNNIINNQMQKINKLELEVLNFEHENKNIKLKYEESINLIKELQNKNSELIRKKEDNENFDIKIMENKYNITKSQYENKILGIKDNLNNITKKYEICKKQYEDIKDKYDIAINNFNQYKIDNEKILNEKNKLIKQLNKLKTDIKLKEEKIIVNQRENEIQKQLAIEEIEEKYKNKIDYNSIKSTINNIYNNIISKNNKINFNNNSNSNISNFITNNSNDLAKLNEINKQINIFFNTQQKYDLLNMENEKLKNHIKEIINITLENTSLMYIRKFSQDSNNINIEILILKIINYIKVIKVCFLLQKIKTVVNFSEKYLNWLNEKEYYKNNNSSIIEIKSEINKINNEIDEIKKTIKNNSFDLEKKFKNYLTKDEVKNELNNMQKKYEKIISGLFEYFLKYKKITDKNNQEFLILQIPIKSYNLMIESNMNNLSLIGQSIESWNLYVSNDMNNSNDSIFQEIINLTNISNLIEYNNLSDVINNNNNETTNNNNINDFVDMNNNTDSNDSDNGNDNEANENNTQNSHALESKSQYSFDNKQ